MLSVSKTVSVSRKSSKREMTRGKKKAVTSLNVNVRGCFCAILRAAFLSDVEDDVAVCRTVKAFGGGVHSSARGGLGLLAGRRVTAFRVRRVAVVRRQLCDVV